MPNYGFAIDLRKCIGCHACTIACKAEHEIPIGVNRCWVKTVEKGTFPNTRRFFFPVLCNQCEEAPCVRICPTGALFKRRDGIVDLHGDACIGCRACMVACPYDQLFIDPNTHTVAWGLDMALYLLTKGIAPGTLLVSLLLPLLVHGDRSPLTTVVGPAISLLFLGITAALLIADLERPERFYYILIRPNWRSWMVWGAYFLTAQGALTASWLLAAIVGLGALQQIVFWPLVVIAMLTTCYTGFLFAQGLARDLW